MNQKIRVCTKISQSAATRKQLVAHFLVPEIELKFFAGREPIRRPRLSSLPFPTDPTTHQIAEVRVSIHIS